MRSINYFVKSFVLFAIIAASLSLTGCKPGLIPSTKVVATRENKKIVDFLEQYKNALEKRSVEGIMELIAKDFYDSMGSDDPSLHVDYLGIKTKLEKTLPRILDSRLGMFVQHIGKIEKDLYEVVFYFNQHILLDAPAGEKWFSIKDINRMTIRERKDKASPYDYEIVKGI